MPIYEYRCSSCGKGFEKLMKISDNDPSCPHCKSSRPRKMVSASGFVLKGSGWFRDGYGLNSSEAKNES